MRKLILFSVYIFLIFACKKEESDAKIERFCWKCTTTPFTSVTKCGIGFGYTSHQKIVISKCEMAISEARDYENTQTSSSSTSVYTTDCASGGYIVTTNGKQTECIKQ